MRIGRPMVLLKRTTRSLGRVDIRLHSSRIQTSVERPEKQFSCKFEKVVETAEEIW